MAEQQYVQQEEAVVYEASDACHQFSLRGSCRFEQNCRYAHIEGAPVPEGYANSGDRECNNWRNTNSCRFGDTCRYTHGGVENPGRRNQRRSAGLCHGFRDTGECRYGEGCRFSHGGDVAAAPAAVDGQQYAPVARAPRAPRPPQLCFNFRDNGSCEYGDDCRFAHGEMDGRDLQAAKRRGAGLCYTFRDQGECRFGDRCRFMHEEAGAEAVEATEQYA